MPAGRRVGAPGRGHDRNAVAVAWALTSSSTIGRRRTQRPGVHQPDLAAAQPVGGGGVGRVQAALPAALDGLVYCPGTIRLRPFERLTDAEWQEDLDLNLLGAVRAIRGALKALRQAESASIVLFSSVAAGTGLPFHASIAAAKGAVEGMTRALAAELAPRIRVNALAPTITDTALAQRLLGTPEKRAAAAERHPLKTIGTPDDIARAALWLLEDARLTTGQVLNLDGGLASIR